MRGPAFSLLLPLCCVLASSAQTGSGSPSATLAIDREAWGCPVSLDVRHGSGLVASHRVKVGESDDLTKPEDGVIRPQAQRLELKIRNLGLQEIASIDGVVRIDGNAARMMHLDRKSDDGEAEPLHLSRRIGKDEVVDVSWSAANPNSIAYVEVDKITYKDGSGWASPAGHACRFLLNPMMLISSR